MPVRNRLISICIASALIIGAFLLFTPARSYAGTIIIQGKPLSYSSIEAAYNDASAGDVLLCEGLFTGPGNHDIAWSKNNITLKASTETSVCTIDAQSQGRIIDIKSSGINLTIEGVTIKNGYDRPPGGGYNGSCIRNGQYNNNIWLNNVVIINCTAELSASGSAIYSYDESSRIFAKNCIFIGNKGGGVAYRGSWEAINCTFVYNSCIDNGGGTSKIVNSIIWGNTTTFGAPRTITYTDIQGGWAGTGNISAAPVFVSTLETDPDFLHLGGGSPCIDKGTGIGAPPKDLAGNSRPRGFGGDMGAYEFQGPSVRVIQPNGGEKITAEASYKIMWQTSAESTTNVKVRLSTNEGLSWDTLITYQPSSHLPGVCTFEWIPMSDQISTHCLISIEVVGWSSGLWHCDTSNATFEIIAPTPVLFSPVYISPEGSDSSGDGSISKPYRTVQMGLIHVSANGEVRAFSGTYAENKNFNILWPNRTNITLRLSPFAAGPATIDAQGVGRIFKVPNTVNLTIEGIAMKNGDIADYGGCINLAKNNIQLWLKNVLIERCTSEAGGGGGIGTDSSFCSIFAQDSTFRGNYSYSGGVSIYINWTASNCAFENNSCYGSGGVIANSGSFFTATNCTFSGNKAFGTVGNGGVFGGCPNVSVTNCIFKDNFSQGNGGVAASSNLSVINCTFYNNKYNSFGGGVGRWGFWNIINSIFWGGNTPFKDTVAGSSMKYCDVQNASWTGFNTMGCISADPLFSNAAGGNFRLLATSECVDSGTFEGAPNFDLDGGIRPMPPWGRQDMGCYELALPIPPVVITLEAPNASNITLEGGEHYIISWEAAGDGRFPSAGDYISIRLSTNGGASWAPITLEENDAGKDTGTYEWTVPNLPARSDNCLISLEAKDVLLYEGRDVSDYKFTILPGIPPLVTVEAPNAPNITLESLSTYIISWDATDNGGFSSSDYISIYYSTGSGWILETTKEANDPGSSSGIYEWTVPVVASTQNNCLVSVEATDKAGNTGRDISNFKFTIVPKVAPAVIVKAPNTGIILEEGERYIVSWDASSLIGFPPPPAKYISISLSTNAGSTWQTLCTTEENEPGTSSGLYEWIVPGGINSSNCLISVEAVDKTSKVGDDVSNSKFTIVPSMPPIVTVQAPSAADLMLQSGKKYIISWEATDNGGFPPAGNYISIYLSTNGGTTWQTLCTTEENEPGTNSGMYEWIVPGGINSSNCLISVEAVDKVSNVGRNVSQNSFSILPSLAPEIIKSSIKIDGVDIAHVGAISGRPIITADIKDDYWKQGIASVEVQIGKYKYVVSPEVVSGNIIRISCSPEVKLGYGSYTVVIYVKNFIGQTDEFVSSFKIYSATLSVIKGPYNIPNPFRPRSGEVTRIVYSLTKDANIKIIIYDITGRAICTKSYSSGSNGGTINNDPSWDGKTDFGKYATNGAYIYLIISGNNVLAKEQMTIAD